MGHIKTPWKMLLALRKVLPSLALLLSLLALPVSALAQDASGEAYPDRGITRFVVDSKHVGHPYEVLLAHSQPLNQSAEAAPLLVVLDGFLLGMTAIETARLMTAAGEIQPIVIAAVSADGAFSVRTARRSPDFSADVDNLREQPAIQGVIPQIDAAGVALEDAFGRSDEYRKFVREELLPNIEKHVAVDGSNLSLLGHSAAGAFALEALLEGDVPFQNYLVGEAGTFMLFGTQDQLVRKASSLGALPGRRMMYADSSDTMNSNTKQLFESKELLEDIAKKLGVEVHTHRYDGETHTTMIPAFIKDGLIYLYGTGRTYSERFAERMGMSKK